MRKPIIIAAAMLAISSAAPLTPASAGTFGQGVSRAAEAVNPLQSAGCYRWGETGYHWYRSCVGPTWLYPHQRSCRKGACVYR
jgi:hypothetical protein